MQMFQSLTMGGIWTVHSVVGFAGPWVSASCPDTPVSGPTNPSLSPVPTHSSTDSRQMSHVGPCCAPPEYTFVSPQHTFLKASSLQLCCPPFLLL